MDDLTRRNILQAIAVVIGSTAIPTFSLAAETAAAPAPDKPRQELLAAVADTLIPRTDSPGTLDAKVPATFQTMLTDWASAKSRAAILSALDAIDVVARGQAGKPFAALPTDARHTLLVAHDAANFTPGTDYRRLRDLIVFLYYMSEPGATQEMRYEHAPGAWIASLPITPTTRTWAGANAF